MNIDKLNIENVTVFEDFKLKSCDGINIIIGENGTGKTHLLKFIYSLSKIISNDNVDTIDIAKSLFKTNPINLLRNQDKESIIDISYNEGHYAKCIIHKDRELDMWNEKMEYNGSIDIKEIFIPAKEMLSHSKGFLALNNKYDMPFDKTYIDIITNAELPETREVSPINKKLLDTISKIIDGTVVYENDNFYIVKNNGNKIEFSLEAEGIRKLGLLWKLIRNGLIEKDTILLWDEPEANINPELIPVLVDILLELQRQGVQMFVATHSYNFAKYFEIKRKENDAVIFHSLYKTENGVKAQSNKYFGELNNNSIIEADSKLLDEVIEESFED